MRKSIYLCVIIAALTATCFTPSAADPVWDEALTSRFQNPSTKSVINFAQYMERRPPVAPFQVEPVYDGGQRAGGRIVLIVNSTIYGAISTALAALYVPDLQAAGYSVDIYTTSGGTPTALRTYIQGLPSDLVGVMLIGDLPIPWFEINTDFPDLSTYSDFPCDLFYMDLDGTWADNQTAAPFQTGVFDSHTDGTGDREPEIWVGRLTASTLTLQGSSEVTLINNYFTKNHNFRIGSLYTGQRALVYVDDDWEPWASVYSSEVSPAYSDRVLISDKATTCRNDYRDIRLSESYELMHVMLHSDYWEHYFKVNDVWEMDGGSNATVTAQDIKNNDPVSIYYNLYCCSAGRYVETNYIGGWYIFTPTHGLGAIATTKVGGMSYNADFYNALGQKKSIGDSFKEWFQSRIPYDAAAVRMWYGMTLLGDGSLVLRPGAMTTVPSPNQVGTPYSANLSVTFNSDMIASGFNNTSLMVHGSRSGLHTGTGNYNAGSRTYTFNPNSDFLDGELVTASLSHTVNSDDNIPTRSHAWSSRMGISNPTAGTFTQHGGANLPLDNDPRRVSSSDFNGDGYADFACLTDGQYSNPGKLWIVINNGDWTTSVASYQLSGVWGQYIACGDFDLDGDIDIAAGSHQPLAQIEVFYNNGSGIFTGPTTYNVGYSPGPIAHGDFDGDGDIDLAALQRSSGPWHEFDYFENNGSGYFFKNSHYIQTNWSCGLLLDSAGDVDADGDLDLIGNMVGANGAADDSLAIFFNSGDGQFTDPTLRRLPDYPTDLCSGDFDGDGDLDIAVSFQYIDSLAVILGAGDGTFPSLTTYHTDREFCQSVICGDWDGDSDLDLAFTAQASNPTTLDLCIMKNSGSGTFGSITATHVWPAAGLIDADIEGDGDLDLIAAGYSANKLIFMKNDDSADTTPPAAVADLSGSGGGRSSTTLVWTAPGDDGPNGLATLYDLRYSTSEVGADTTAWWNSATEVTGEPAPSFGGWRDSCTVDGLSEDQVYFFVLKTADDVPNWSGYSNVAYIGADWVEIGSALLGDADCNGQGIAWGDFDNDGDQDLYVTNFGQANKLFRNDGGDSFIDATTAPLGDTGSNQGCAWGDYDTDGDLDLYVANSTGSNKLFRNDGGGTFSDATTPPLEDAYWGTGVAWGDYDNDGDIDLYLGNHSANKLFRNDGGGSFADATTGFLGDLNNAQGLAWADYDNDGDLDLYISNTSSAPNRLLRNDGGSGFTDVTSGLLGDASNSQGVAWADYDNDGDLDLFIANWGTSNRLLRNDGSDTFTDVTSDPLGGSTPTYGAAWADYDNDSDLDLYLTNYGAANQLLQNDGSGVFTDVTSGPLGNSGDNTGVAWADYDNDGDLDLYIVNFNGSNQLLRNDSNLSRAGNWLHVHLQGTTSSSDAIGARVRIVTGETGQIREISGGSSCNSQNSLIAEFGLGAYSQVDTLEIRWPSGTVDLFTDVAGGALVQATESTGQNVQSDLGGIAQTRLLPISPNPFRAMAAVRFELPHREQVMLNIFDINGRCVRTLIQESVGTGSHTLAWDGQDERGVSVASGVYLVQMVTGTMRQSRPVVLLR